MNNPLEMNVDRFLQNKEHQKFQNLTHFEIGVMLSNYVCRMWQKVTIPPLTPDFFTLLCYPHQALANHMTEEGTIEFTQDFLNELFENRTTFIEIPHDMGDMGEKSAQEKTIYKQNSIYNQAMHRKILANSIELDNFIKTIDGVLKKGIYNTQKEAWTTLISRVKSSLPNFEKSLDIENFLKPFWDTLSPFHQKFLPFSKAVSEVSNNQSFLKQAKHCVETAAQELSIKALKDCTLQQAIINRLTNTIHPVQFLDALMPTLQDIIKNPSQKAFQASIKPDIKKLVREVFEKEAEKMQDMLNFFQNKNIIGWQIKLEEDVMNKNQKQIDALKEKLAQKRTEVRLVKDRLIYAQGKIQEKRKYIVPIRSSIPKNKAEVPNENSELGRIEQIQKNKKRPAKTTSQDLEAGIKNSQNIDDV